jgi:two-component system LytT family response regulator
MHLLRRTLDGLLADLGPGFVRIHRSRAVALGVVTALQTTGRGPARVMLNDGTLLACSPAGRQALQQALAAR